MDASDLKNALFGDSALNQYGYVEPGNAKLGFSGLLSSILPTIFILAGFILFLYILFGGFLVISSAGNAKKTEEGTQAITNAIIGFVIIFTSYWLIQIIEVITGIPIL